MSGFVFAAEFVGFVSWLQAAGEGGDVLGGGAGREQEKEKEDRKPASDDAPRRKLRKYR